MSPIFDCACSILLCAEDKASLLGFDDEAEEEESSNRPWWTPEPKRCDFYGDLFVEFLLQSDEALSLLVERELEHRPREDYGERLRSGSLDFTIRSDCIDWMCKTMCYLDDFTLLMISSQFRQVFEVHAYYKFGPLSAYLSANYLDRFLSACELPQGKAWMAQLLSVACLSLAIKMEETAVPLSLDLQVGDATYVFDARTIQRMELLVLSTLKWRMQSVTPFSFIDFFLHKFNGGNAPSKSLILRSADIILSTVGGIGFLQFRPSVISAAIALVVLEEIQFVDAEKVLSSCPHLAKEDVLECYELVQDKVLMRNKSGKDVSSSLSSVPQPQSPIGVLDAACLSDDATAILREANRGASPPSKKRKISR